MSKLEKLIKELCPNGVEYTTLGNIATNIFRGSGIKREQVTEDGIPCVRYGEIYTTYGIYFDTCVSHINETMVQSKKYFGYGDILFAITGESVEDIAKSTAYVGHEKCLAGGDIVVLKHNQNPKYISYALSTISVHIQKIKGKVKSKVVHSSIPAIKDIIIPLPPLPVQEEIVKILDKYSESVTKLQKELEKELQARKKQYEFYRNKLLTFDINGGIGEVEWRKLGEIAEIGTGNHNTNEELEVGNYPFFVRSQEVRRLDKYDYDETAIIIPGDGNVGNIFHYINGKYALHQRAYRIHITAPDVLPKYYFYYMKSTFSKYIEKSAVNSSVMSIRRPMLNNYPIPIPSLPIQERIVNVFDNFDTVCSDLNISLSAEFEARQKQYEYYRDLLLSFDSRSQVINVERERE